MYAPTAKIEMIQHIMQDVKSSILSSACMAYKLPFDIIRLMCVYHILDYMYKNIYSTYI